MVARSVAYANSGQVDPSTFGDDDYFTARLSVARAQEHPDSKGQNVYSLVFAQLEADRVLPRTLKYSFTDRDGSFKGRMGVFVARQLRGKHVVGVFRRSDNGIEAVIPSNEIL